jgi:transcription antitermination factor NusG
MTEINKKWFVVYTLPRWEKKVALLLQEKGIEYYCPLNKVTKQWSDRVKVVVEPLFKGYVFVHVAEVEKWDIRQVQGVLNYVHWQGKPAVIRDEEIDVIRKFLHEFADVAVANTSMEVSSKVIIKQGILMNYHGIVLEVVGAKARVRISSMGLELSAVFDKKNLNVVGG